MGSLSPLASSGPNANEFNSLGMWAAIACVLAVYLLPLFIFVKGLSAMRYVMAVLCGLGIVTIISIILGVLVLGSFSNNFSAFLGVIALSLATLIANVMWLVVAFRPSPKLEVKN